MIRLQRVLFCLVLLSAACAGSNNSGPHGASGMSGSAGASGGAGQGGSQSASFIPFTSGSPASVFWDDQDATLFIDDNENNQVWKWTDADGLSAFATTPDPGGELAAGASLVGQIIKLADGRLLIARFGKPGGGFAGLAWVTPDGNSGLVPVADDTLKRLGLTQAQDGTIYGSYFGRAPGGSGQAGTVTRIDLESGETVVADGFGKIVGVLASGDTLYVSDQSAGTIFSAPLAALPEHASGFTAFAKLSVPDQLCKGPAGSIFTGQFQAAAGSTDPVAIRQIGADGSVSLFAKDPDVAKPSGVSFDPTHHRLFAADTGNSAKVGVHVLPVP